MRSSMASSCVPCVPIWTRAALPLKSATSSSAQRLFELNQYLHDHYDVPITLSQLGVERAILPKVARQARYDGAALYNKHEVTEEIALHILEEAY